MWRGDLDIAGRGTTNREQRPIQSIRSCHFPIYLNRDTAFLALLTRLRFARGDTHFRRRSFGWSSFAESDVAAEQVDPVEERVDVGVAEAPLTGFGWAVAPVPAVAVVGGRQQNDR